MTFSQSLILGIVQGLTEFLPVSSSGHLVVMEAFLKISNSSLTFDLLLHLATTLALIVFFWKQLVHLRFKQLLVIILANVPIGIVGILFRDKVEVLFGSLWLVSLAFLVTGVLNIFSDRILSRKAKQSESAELSGETGVLDFPNAKQGLLVGLFQMVALTPGISRSGSTVFAGLLSGLDRETAFSFSFLLIIPAILGGVFIEARDTSWQADLQQNLSVYFLGLLASFVVGLLSLWVLRHILMSSRWRYFGYYCLLLGGGLVVSQVLGLV